MQHLCLNEDIQSFLSSQGDGFSENKKYSTFIMLLQYGNGFLR